MGILDYELPEGCDGLLPCEPLPVPTGLNDEDDARRYLAQTFNAGFHCRRCDGHWEQEHASCPVCIDGWRDPTGPIGPQGATQVSRAQRKAAFRRRQKTWQA